YRMFTSRAEHRLLLGCDSVYERLSHHAERRGLLDPERRRRIENRLARVTDARTRLEALQFLPDKETAAWFEELGTPLNAPATLGKLLQRNDFAWVEFASSASASDRWSEALTAAESLGEEELDGVLNALRYAGYVEKQAREAHRSRADEDLRIPHAFSYHRPGLSRELVEKL
ncbi:MAG: hypothetical protein ABR524_12945, partial [Thermoanaerobaculia bacterium]